MIAKQQESWDLIRFLYAFPEENYKKIPAIDATCIAWTRFKPAMRT